MIRTDKKKTRVIIMSLLLLFLSVWMATSGYSVSDHLSLFLRSDGASTGARQIGLDFGWTGYINSSDEVIPLLDRLVADGWSAIRYQSEPLWWNASTRHPLNYTILDFLVDEAEQRGMRTYLLTEHTFQPNLGGSGNFIDGHEAEWIADWQEIGTRYANRDVLIDAWSEYNNLITNRTEATKAYQQLAQDLVDSLRRVEFGVNLPIHFNLWWNSRVFALNDTNYSVGRHLYGGAFDNYNPPTPIDFETAAEESGVNAKINQYFFESNNMFYQEAKRLNVTFLISEMGASENQTKAYGGRYSMSVGNIAYVLKLLETALEFNVSSIMHRAGEYSDYELYYQYAQQYFQVKFFTPPLFGDVNSDHMVDAYDLQALGLHWQSDPPVDPRYDLNGDGKIDRYDLAIIGRQWGKHW